MDAFASRTPLPVPVTGERGASGDPFSAPASSRAPYETRAPGTLDPVCNMQSKPFRLFEEAAPGSNLGFRETQESTMSKTAGILESPLTKAYFSRDNLDVVQRTLAGEVARLTGFRIDRQDDTQMLIVMRGIFLDHAKNAPRDVAAEVRRLNAGVVSTLIDQVVSGITARLSYLRDASRMRTPIPRGSATSIKGLSTTLPLFRPI